MADHTSLVVRTIRAGESDAVRDVTLAAYEEYAAIMPAQFWTGYRRHLLATLDAEGAADRIVAERQGVTAHERRRPLRAASPDFSR